MSTRFQKYSHVANQLTGQQIEISVPVVNFSCNDI